MCECGSFHTNSRVDPTRTTALRNRWEADFNRRWVRLEAAITREVQKKDGFGLSNNRRLFDFPTRQSKVSAFMAWMQKELDATIFDGTMGLARSVAVQQSWMNTYVQSAYRRGLLNSATQLRQRGARVGGEFIEAAFLRPIHADAIGIVYTRTYEDLRAVTKAMDEGISKVLAEGLADGRSPLDIARSISNRVDKIGRTRAKLIARTETAYAHSEAQLNLFQEAGLQNVGVMAEMLTAGDNLVCPECQAFAEAGPYPISHARGQLPLHPNCRCAWIPADVGNLILGGNY